MPKLLSIPLLFVIATLAGCKSVTSNDLVGTWVMKDTSRDVLSSGLQKASPKLVLNTNGSFVASDMPGLFYFPGLRPERLENGTGVWRLASSGGEEQVQLDFQSIEDWQERKLPFGTQVYLSKGWSDISLYYTLGDPDEGRRVEFKKK